jgi:hypothetical protein
MEIHQPAMFVAGTADGVVMMAAAALEAMPHFVQGSAHQSDDPASATGPSRKRRMQSMTPSSPSSKT